MLRRQQPDMSICPAYGTTETRQGSHVPGQKLQCLLGFLRQLFPLPLPQSCTVLHPNQWVLSRSLLAPKMWLCVPFPRSLVLVLSWQPDTTGISKQKLNSSPTTSSPGQVCSFAGDLLKAAPFSKVAGKCHMEYPTSATGAGGAFSFLLFNP